MVWLKWEIALPIDDCISYWKKGKHIVRFDFGIQDEDTCIMRFDTTKAADKYIESEK